MMSAAAPISASNCRPRASGPNGPRQPSSSIISKTPAIRRMRQLASGLLLAMLLTGQQLVTALKVTVAIPDLVAINDAFWLNCSHNSPHRLVPTSSPNGGNKPQANNNNNNNNNYNNFNHVTQAQTLDNFQQIYSIKWFKDNVEFYSFLPRGESRVSHYETKGVQVDKGKTFDGNVFVAKADLNTEGTYRCEIVSEGPTFETVAKSRALRVFAPPVRSPKIEILDPSGRAKNPRAQEIVLEVGDKIELRCNSAPSKPAACLRWYLNDREIATPCNSSPTSSSSTSTSTAQTRPTSAKFVQSAQTSATNQAAYNINVTQVEFRVQFRSIMSSHSTLSLLLDREDLVRKRMSFKCLAVVRQEVSLASKQLVLLTSQLTSASGGPSRRPAESSFKRRQMRRSAGGGGGSGGRNTKLAHEHKASYEEPNVDSMMYIYEGSDSTLGSSIIDSPELLAAHLAASSSGNYEPDLSEQQQLDNLMYIQQLRERHQSRQRSLPAAGGAHASQQAHQKHKQHFGHHNIVKSPFYPDELDSFRPVINWPPLDSGRLLLLPPDQSQIVAIPTRSLATASSQNEAESIWVKPPGRSSSLIPRLQVEAVNEMGPVTSRMILDKLFEQLNCTCGETNLDTKLRWTVNERDLDDRDTRHYPNRISPDHRQTWMTIGLGGWRSSNLLTSAMAQAQAQTMANSQMAALRSGPVHDGDGQPQPVGNEQLKLMCQAQHSMLLQSSSETITFDFSQNNNNNNQEPEVNSLDKYASSPSHVIQAAPTRSKSSSSWSNSIAPLRSQILIVFMVIISSLLLG